MVNHLEGFTVKDVYQRICVLTKRCCVDYYLIELRELLKEEFSARSYKNEDIAHIPFDFYWKYYVWLLSHLETRMHQCLIQVKHKSLFTYLMRLLRSDGCQVWRQGFFTELLILLLVLLLNHIQLLS